MQKKITSEVGIFFLNPTCSQSNAMNLLGKTQVYIGVPERLFFFFSRKTFKSSKHYLAFHMWVFFFFKQNSLANSFANLAKLSSLHD